MTFGNKVYDRLKFTAQILLPACATLYFAIAGIWGLPKAEEVVGTIVAFDTFLGAILALSSTAYKKQGLSHDGYIYATGQDPDTGIPDLALTITKDPTELLANPTVNLKVDTPPEPK